MSAKCLASLLVFLGLIAPSFASASARDYARTCPAHRTPVSTDTDKSGILWISRGSLYSCARNPGKHRSRARRLGPWTAGGRLATDDDGFTVVWTRRHTVDGVRSDRIWAADAIDGQRFLAGKLLVPRAGGEPESGARIAGLVAGYHAAAWTTRTGEVGVALSDPDGGPVLGDGSELKPDHNRALLGRFPDADPAQLRSSLRVEFQSGEGDECASTGTDVVSVVPVPGGASVTLSWNTYEVSDLPYC